MFSSRSSHKQDRPRRRHRHHERYETPEPVAGIDPSMFSIDVGTAKPFKAIIRNASRFIFLADGPNKLCTKIEYNNSEEVNVMCIKWSYQIHDVNITDAIASQIGSCAIETPRNVHMSLHVHQEMNIRIYIRSYIPGRPLATMIHTMTESEISSVELQVSSIVWDLSKKVSPHFGHLKYKSTRTASAGSYLTMIAFMDSMNGLSDGTLWNEISTDQYVGSAVFCHGALTADHIIMDGSMVVGIVGWTSADFVPEAYDRLNYYFMSSDDDMGQWNMKMSNVTISLSTPPPSVEFVLNVTTYTYKSAWRNAKNARRGDINKLWANVRNNYKIVPSLADATEIECDNMSLSSLTSWTDNTNLTQVGFSD